MSTKFLSNIGPADEIRKEVSVAIGNTDSQGTIFLLLDTARTVRIDRWQRSETEMVVQAIDIEDGSSILLHVPHDNSAASAYIITYLKGEH